MYWNESCIRLVRDPPSMQALPKRIRYSKGVLHEDFKLAQFYKLDCLFLSPHILLEGNRYVMIFCFIYYALLRLLHGLLTSWVGISLSCFDSV